MKHPYKNLPDKSFWRRSVASIPMSAVDPVGTFGLKISIETKVATAGSCFAQHIARHLKNVGFNYYVTEPGHPILSEATRESNNYGLFSARYGNIYTARQLLQLFLRAYGKFNPTEDVWVENDGRVLDPYRPTTQPNGFISVDEMHVDRRQHLAAVRKMFETMDVFVFTLGLTECWMNKHDGAVFPVCPGVDGGKFDTDVHVFHNQDVNEVQTDMSTFLEMLRKVNQKVQVVLTVSPVPLAATANADEHVLAATTYSKSVLRVAAEMLKNRYPHVHYFPSYEIITGNFNRGAYYAQDLRNVTEQGVRHVMELFLRYVTDGKVNVEQRAAQVPERKDEWIQKAEEIVQALCDEAMLDQDEETEKSKSRELSQNPGKALNGS